MPTDPAARKDAATSPHQGSSIRPSTHADALKPDTPAQVPGMRLRSAARILHEDPDAGAAPKPVVPRVCYEGRLTLLVAREKVGKSTLSSALSTAVASGTDFLGAPCQQGLVVWLRLEEATGDLIRRLKEFGTHADFEQILVADRIENPRASYAQMIRDLRPALVVVDTLTDYAALHDEHPQSGDSAGWNQIINALRDPIRDTRTSVLVLHHRAKEGGGRDSTAIAAGADLVLEMTPSKAARKVTSKGRWDTDDFVVRLDDGGYTLLAPKAPLSDRIVALVQQEGPASKSKIRTGVTGRNESIDAALDELVEEGRLTTVRDGKYVVFAVPMAA